jgi:SAM-dependent methyltransferase
MKSRQLMTSAGAYLKHLLIRVETAGGNFWHSFTSRVRSILGFPQSPRDFYPEYLTKPKGSIAPFVPSPMDVVRKMLNLAELKSGETLYDLGCGDGRIVIMAAREFEAKAVGVDLNRMLISEAEKKARELGLGDSVRFIQGNMFDVDLESADVVTMYLLTSANEKVRPKLESELRPGARVITHDFPLITWRYQSRVNYDGETGRHVLFLYICRGNNPQQGF